MNMPSTSPRWPRLIPASASSRRLTESARAPHFFLTNAANVERLMGFRAEVNQRYAEGNVKVSVTDLLVRACATTLREHPKINASWGQDKILQHRRIHIGVAVALDDGFIVPVIADADAKGLDVIARATRALAERARAGRPTPDEFSGGTFTISNLGTFGIDNFTAVINPPEAAILAVGGASDEPFVHEGQLLTRPILKVTLTVDHRVLDGATAAAFARPKAHPGRTAEDGPLTAGSAQVEVAAVQLPGCARCP